MRQCYNKLSGVLNGIDMKLYDPASDPRIHSNFSAADLAGKAADKAELQKMTGLRVEPHTPVVAMVTRLVSHKGLDLICEVIHDMMELPMQLVVLGTGDQRYEEFFHWAAQQYPGRMAVRLDYNEELSMAIYAGADLFLMPSKSEPCGLSQMIAMRYGTVPIVRETGGLKDTVHPYEAWRDAGNGFTFANYASNDMLHVIREAVYLYKDFPDAFGRLRKRAMECDFSWARSAGEYLRIYAGVTGQVWPAPEAAPVEERPAAEPVSVEEAAAPAEEASAVEEAGPFEEPAPAAETVPETVAAEKASAGRSVEKAAPAGETADVKAEPKKRGRKPGTKNGAKKEPARKAAEKKAAGETKKKGTAAKK